VKKCQKGLIFEGLIWVAQSTTRGNVQTTAVDLAKSLGQAVLAVWRSKKLDFQMFPFLAAGGVLSVINHCETVLAIYNISLLSGSTVIILSASV
jgi:hypothetical protein